MNKREWMLRAAIVVLGKNILTLTHDLLAKELSGAYDAIVAATPEPTDEGWIEHRGEKPYPEGLVEVRRRSGAVWGDDADEFIWTWDPDFPEADIVAWRPAR